MLVLYWSGRDVPSNVAFAQHLQTAFKSIPNERVECCAEYLDANQFPGEGQAGSLRDSLQQKYGDGKIDVVLAVSPAPLRHLLAYRDDLFPGTPVVFYTADGLEEEDGVPGPQITGVSSPGVYARTLDTALGLHPEATQVFIVSGAPSRDRTSETEIRQELRTFEERVGFTYFTDLPLDELIAAVKTIPERSVILYGSRSHDRSGSANDVLHLISRSALAPVYSPGESYLGEGIVGGSVIDLKAGAASTAAIALRVALGARPQDIPLVQAPTIPAFDARQLARWGILEHRLPPGSIVLFREATIWDRYKRFIFGTGTVVAVQTILISGLLLQRARRRRAEASLKRIAQRHELANAAARVGVWDWNLQTNELYVEPVLKRALGFADREIDSRPESWASHVHPADATRVRREAEAHIDARTPAYEVEHRMLHKDGSTRWFMARGAAVRLPDGRAVRVIGTDTDITEQKRAETRLQAAQDELTRVSQLTAMNGVAASIVHEISQPLGAILINASACLRWLRSQAPPIGEIHAALLDIADAGNRAKELMRRNRELIQNVRLKKAALDVNSVVRDVALLARTRLESNQVTLGATLEEGLPAVLGDRVELQQVLLSLLVNAINAMETVDPTSRQIQIDSSLAKEEGMVRITVRDNGIGLEGVAVERMLTPSYTAKPAGTGFGLSICRSIVDAHGGQLWAERHDGPGATFCFTLPTAGASAAGSGANEIRGTEGDRRPVSSVNRSGPRGRSTSSRVKHDERLTGAYRRS